MSQLRFSIAQNGLMMKIQDNQNKIPVCHMHPVLAPDQMAGMAKVMCDALNQVEVRRPPQQKRLA
jgi:hypothetical protein